MATKGNCYISNAKHLIDMPTNDWKLVHGIAEGQEGSPIEGLKFGHCWLERGNEILDFSNSIKLRYPKDFYYALGHIDESNNYYYTKDELINWILKEKTWGPWESKPIR